MRSRHQFTRCYICGLVLTCIGFRFQQFGWTGGWHKTYALCQPCAKAIFEVAHEVRQEYR